MKVLVCGSRDYADLDHMLGHICLLQPKEMMHGGASGADTLAGVCAHILKVPCRVFKADWHKYGKAAGPIRNEEALREGKPDLVVAFPGGKGTADMVRQAENLGIPVLKIKGRYDDMYQSYHGVDCRCPVCHE